MSVILSPYVTCCLIAQDKNPGVRLVCEVVRCIVAKAVLSIRHPGCGRSLADKMAGVEAVIHLVGELFVNDGILLV